MHDTVDVERADGGQERSHHVFHDCALFAPDVGQSAVQVGVFREPRKDANVAAIVKGRVESEDVRVAKAPLDRHFHVDRLPDGGVEGGLAIRLQGGDSTASARKQLARLGTQFAKPMCILI